MQTLPLQPFYLACPPGPPHQVWGNVIMLPGRVAFIHGSTSDECGMFLRPRLTRRAKAD